VDWVLAGFGTNEARFAVASFADGIAGAAGFDLGFAELLNEEIDGVTQFEQCDVGLDAEVEFLGVGIAEAVRIDLRARGAVEGDDASPFDSCHIESEV